MNNYQKAEMHFSIVLWILLMAGLSRAEIDCTASVLETCRRDEVIFFLPSTEDELHIVCTSMLNYLDCVKNVTGTCEEHREHFTTVTQVQSIMQDVCSEDTALHRAVADNLLCMKNIFTEYAFCDMPMEGDEIETYAETVKERGITHLGKSEEKSLMCMRYLYMFGCYTAGFGKECGNTARNAMLEIYQRFLEPVSECREEVVEDFPAVVELFEAVENKVQERD